MTQDSEQNFEEFRNSHKQERNQLKSKAQTLKTNKKALEKRYEVPSNPLTPRTSKKSSKP